MATPTDTQRRDGQPASAERGPTPTPQATPAEGPKPIPDTVPRRRRDSELKAIETALQTLDGDTAAVAATSACLSALAQVADGDRRAAIVTLLGLTPAGMKLAKVVLEDRWTRDGQTG